VQWSTPSKTEKETADRTGAGNVKTPVTTARERGREKTFGAPVLTVTLSGCRSRRAHLRRERWKNEHRKKEKANKRKHRARENKTLQAQPSKEKKGDIPSGYSGRTDLRME
jgi:hypothetical protein